MQFLDKLVFPLLLQQQFYWTILRGRLLQNINFAGKQKSSDLFLLLLKENCANKKIQTSKILQKLDDVRLLSLNYFYELEKGYNSCSKKYLNFHANRKSMLSQIKPIDIANCFRSEDYK